MRTAPRAPVGGSDDLRNGPTDQRDYAAPARMDIAGLPPTYIDVGELDIFRDEAIVYGRRLARAGTSTELHVRPGCPHQFDQIAPLSDVAVRAQRDRRRVLHLL
jgi:acetyl esterase/lipase